VVPGLVQLEGHKHAAEALQVDLDLPIGRLASGSCAAARWTSSTAMEPSMRLSIREIARRTGLRRGTVKKYLRAGEELPRYAKRASSSKLEPYAEKLASWLAIEATKSQKQRRSLRQIHIQDESKGRVWLRKKSAAQPFRSTRSYTRAEPAFCYWAAVLDVATTTNFQGCNWLRDLNQFIPKPIN